jgi:hypothetical protein
MSDDQSQPGVEPEVKPDVKPEAAAEVQSEVAASAPAKTEPDVPPDRLSINPMSRYYDEELLRRGVGIRFKGKKRTNVQEYCISEAWVTMAIGKTVDRRGMPLTVKSKGPVEAWFEDLGDEPPVASAS